MQTGTKKDKNDRLVAWNGLQLFLPKTWDARVSGNHHLVFEKNFLPLLQIRWEHSDNNPSHNIQKRAKHCAAELGLVIAEDSLPEDLQPMQDNFDQVTCYRDENNMIKGGICLCADCRTLVLFQLLAEDPALVQEVNVCLATLSYRKQAENLWRIQDFTLNLPLDYTLRDYTFAAGLTRLAFFSGDLFLQTCIIGPADIRLNRQSLEEILITLTGTRQLQLVTEENYNSCTGTRTPTISQQIIFRLRREKSFIRAEIRHDIGSNRLLAVVLSANRPIAPTTLYEVSRQYEIIKK